MEKIKILLDTDMGSDCDDAGALAVLHNIADETEAEILAVTHCSSGICGPVAVKCINEWYGRADIPIGKYYEGRFLEEDNCLKFTKPLTERYLKSSDMPDIENATEVMRRVLVENQGITLIAIGMLNNIAELLKSGADETSPLSGVELVKNSVEKMYVMGGNFLDSNFEEYNIKTDIGAAKYVSENFPAPIIYCGFELGVDVLTGRKIMDDSDDNPVSLAYHIHCGYNSPEYRSWDLVTVYNAVFQNSDLYKKSKNVHITFDDKGRTNIGGEGKDFYLTQVASNAQISAEINKYLI